MGITIYITLNIEYHIAPQFNSDIIRNMEKYAKHLYWITERSHGVFESTVINNPLGGGSDTLPFDV